MEGGAGEPEGRDPLMRRSNSGGSTLLELDIARVYLDHTVRSGGQAGFHLYKDRRIVTDNHCAGITHTGDQPSDSGNYVWRGS
jgi:hypothetical protein